jgi:hypothetical protein
MTVTAAWGGDLDNRATIAVSSAQVDDLGNYRLGGLPKGTYSILLGLLGRLPPPGLPGRMPAGPSAGGAAAHHDRRGGGTIGNRLHHSGVCARQARRWRGRSHLCRDARRSLRGRTLHPGEASADCSGWVAAVRIRETAKALRPLDASPDDPRLWAQAAFDPL